MAARTGSRRAQASAKGLRSTNITPKRGEFKGRDVVAAREARDNRPNGHGPVEHHDDRPGRDAARNVNRNDRPSGTANREHEPARTDNPHTSNARDTHQEPSHGKDAHASESHGNKGHEVQRENPGKGNKDNKKP